MTASLFVIPVLLALVCFFGESRSTSRLLLLFGGVIHLLLVLGAWFEIRLYQTSEWIGLDELGLIFLTIVSVLFLLSACYAGAYLKQEASPGKESEEEKLLFENASERIFCGCLLLFLAAMSFVTVSQHFGLLWVALESTTIVSAPLVCFHLHNRSLEAMWKYVLVCSVGVTLGLLGTFFLAASLYSGGNPELLFTVRYVSRVAETLNPLWLQLAFIFIFVGFGTKMGLAPFHFWLPDAHSESPSFVSALLSGALLNCAFLAILRFYQVVVAAGRAAFAQHLLFTFGFISIIAAAVFIVRQRDYKRLLAYSSVEHMGILSLGFGLGAPGAAFAALLHAINHSFVKGMLFMLSGNFLRTFRTKNTYEIRGAIKAAPFTAALWILGFFAVTGLPPFGIFLSKFLLLRAAIQTGWIWTAAVLLVLLAIVFIAFAAVSMQMVFGEDDSKGAVDKTTLMEKIPPLTLLVLVLLLGLYLPPGVRQMLEDAAALVGGK